MYRCVAIISLCLIVPWARAWSAAPPSSLETIVRGLLVRGQIDSAIYQVDSALTVNPGSPAMHYLKSDVLLQLADTAGAIQYLDDVLRLQPLHSPARRELIQLLLDTQDNASALRVARQTPARTVPRRPEDMVLWGRAYEAQGIDDTAITYYKQAYKALARRPMLLPPVPRQTPVSHLRVSYGDDRESIWTPGGATIFVFWAQWSAESRAVLGEISANVKKAAIRWNLIPVNVDDLQSSDVAKLRETALSLGCKDTVQFDTGWRIVRQWSIDRLPCVVLVDQGGRVEEIIHGWDDSARDRILSGALGSLSDSLPERLPVTPDVSRSRAGNLRGAARQAWSSEQYDRAMQIIGKSVDADSTFYPALVDQAVYRWLRGDTLGARTASDRLRGRPDTDIWTDIVSAFIADAHGRSQEAVSILADSSREQRAQAEGAYQAATALFASHAGLWEQAQAARNRCDTLNPFNPLLPEVDALIAEQRAPDSAAERWHRAVLDRLSSLAR